jgi:hypothetical protein
MPAALVVTHTASRSRRRPRGNGRSRTVTVNQSAEDAGPQWRRYFDLMNRGWERALVEMKDHLDREQLRSIR